MRRHQHAKNVVVPKCDTSHYSFNSDYDEDCGGSMISLQSLSGRTTATQETALACNINSGSKNNNNTKDKQQRHRRHPRYRENNNKTRQNKKSCRHNFFENGNDNDEDSDEDDDTSDSDNDNDEGAATSTLLSGVKISSSSNVIEVESTIPSKASSLISPSRKAWKGIKKRIMRGGGNKQHLFFNRERSKTDETPTTSAEHCDDKSNKHASSQQHSSTRSRSRSLQHLGRGFRSRRRCRTSSKDGDCVVDFDSKEKQRRAIAVEQAITDDAIRGRLDGMDVLSLGSSRMRSVPSSNSIITKLPHFLTQPITVKKSFKYVPSQMVKQMIWMSAGRDVPEMFLEAFAPDDRWMVRMDEVKSPLLLLDNRRTPYFPPSSSNVSISTPTTASLSTSSSYDLNESLENQNAQQQAALSTTRQQQQQQHHQQPHRQYCATFDRIFQCNNPCVGGATATKSVISDDGSDEYAVDESEVLIPARLLEQQVWGNSPIPPTHLSRRTTRPRPSSPPPPPPPPIPPSPGTPPNGGCFGGVPSCVNTNNNNNRDSSITNMKDDSIIVDSSDDDDENDDSDDDDDVLNLAAAMSVPVDIDEDTLIIETQAHLQALHDIASVPLRQGKYDKSISIFQKILKGLKQRVHENNNNNNNTHNSQQNQQNAQTTVIRNNEHLIGSTYHNIGIIQMWAGQYQDALDNFEQAVLYRKKILPKNHTDIAVSLMRQGIAHFALCDYSLAIDCYKNALHICTYENMTRAKILNNMGVAYYQKEQQNNCLSKSLDYLTNALEIQRTMLDSPIKRDTIVYDASITLGNMGKVYIEREDYELALYVYEEALLLQTSTYSKDSNIVLQSLSNLAYTKALNKQYKESIQTYKSVLRIQEQKFGVKSEEYIETSGLIGHLYVQLLQQQQQRQKQQKQKDNNKSTSAAATSAAASNNGNDSKWRVETANEAIKYLKVVLKWQERNNNCNNNYYGQSNGSNGGSSSKGANNNENNKKLQQYTKKMIEQMEQQRTIKKDITVWV